MQNSIRNSTISTTMEISENVEVGKLIGRGGRNIKPIERGTDENISLWEWINKAICQIDNLLEDIEVRNRKKDIEKEKNNSRISDQHATSRNHKKRRMPHTTKARQPQNKENMRRNVPYYNRSN
ncbi:unnamed protein product [Rhizophagus irregularis]|nr:unnamed protein product [Rhizophagus irregularis]